MSENARLRGLPPAAPLWPLVAAIPLLVVAASDAPACGSRDITVGLSLAGTRDVPPLVSLLGSLFALLPLGPATLRAALAAAIPAAFAAALVTARAQRTPHAAPRWAATAIVLAFGAMSAILLASARPAIAIAVCTTELALFAIASGSRASASLALALVTLLAWADIRLLPIALISCWAARRLFGGALVAVAAVGVALPLLVLDVVREPVALVSFGRFRWVPPHVSALPLLSGPIGRLLIVIAALALLAFLLGRSERGASDEEATVRNVALAAGVSIALGAGDASVLIAVTLAPLATSACLALHRLTGDEAPPRARPWQRVLTLLVPALVLGLAARAIEDRLTRHRRGLDVVAVAELAPVQTLGLAPAAPVVALDDEATLLAWSGARVSLGLRPDVLLLPMGSHLLGAPAHAAGRTIEQEPNARPVLRAMLAAGAVEEADAAPLCQLRPLLLSLDPTRAKNLARHAKATPAGLRFALERVDPSDRRLARPALDRRLATLASTSEPKDAIRASARRGAEMEAYLLSLAQDRDGALAALSRSARLGSPETATARWSARIVAKAPVGERIEELE